MISLFTFFKGFLNPNDYFSDSYFYKNNYKVGSTEDLLSETGTYIIENDNNNNKKDKLDALNNCGSYNDAEFEIRTKAINQAFGIDYNTNNINDDVQSSSEMVKDVGQDELTPRNSVGNKNLKLFSSSNSTSPSSASSIESEQTNARNIVFNGNSSGITKTLTYDVLKIDGSVDIETNKSCSQSINTNLLLGDTDNLMNKINEKNKDFEALSTRATVNSSHAFKEPLNFNRKHNGGLSFSVDLDSDNDSSLKSSIQINSGRLKPKLKPATALQDQTLITRDMRNQSVKKLDVNKSRTSDSILTTSNDYETVKSMNTEPSLGTRIQNLTMQTESFHRRASVSSEKEFKPISAQATIPTSMVTNRTLILRQQSAKAKRESSVNTNNRTSQIGSQKPSTSNSSKERDKAPISDRTTTTRSSSKAPKSVSDNSRSSSPSIRQLASQHTPAKDAFLRRKTYDPVKAVEDARIKQKLKQTNGSSFRAKNPVKTSDNEDDCSVSSSMDLMAPLEKLNKSIAANKQVRKI